MKAETAGLRDALGAKPVIHCSQLDRFLACPGSLLLQQRVAEGVGAEAREGRWLHAAIALRLEQEMDAVRAGAAGKNPPPESEAPPAGSGWVVDYCLRFARRAVPARWSLEVEAPFAHEFARFTLAGRLDCLALNADATASEAIEWKTGRTAVDPAEANQQCLGYLVLQKKAYPALRRARFTLVQPRAAGQGRAPASAVTATGTEINQAAAWLEQRINAALDRLEELNTGPRQCRWCPAALQCPAAQAERNAMQLKLTSESLARIQREPDDATLADWMVAAQAIEHPLREAKTLLHERLAQAGPVTTAGGATIASVEQPGPYRVADPERLYASVCATLPAPEIARLLDPSAARLKAAIARMLGLDDSGRRFAAVEKLFTERFAPHFARGKRRTFTVS